MEEGQSLQFSEQVAQGALKHLTVTRKGRQTEQKSIRKRTNKNGELAKKVGHTLKYKEVINGNQAVQN